jgi:hypothetical protein
MSCQGQTDSETVIQGFPEIISVNISPDGGVGSTANSLLSRYYRRQAVDSIRRFLIAQIWQWKTTTFYNEEAELERQWFTASSVK